MKANLAWLGLILCVLALAAGYWPRSRGIVSLRLLLAARPIALSDDQPLFVEGDCFQMALHSMSDGSAQMSASQRSQGLMSQEILTRLSAREWTALKQGLWELPGWRERQCDGGEAEGQALYTLLEIETDQGKFRSNWRGLPKAQAEVANLLLKSPAGGPLSRGLAQLQKTTFSTGP